MTRMIAFGVFRVMLGLFMTADKLFVIVLTEKWLPTVPYFQILIISAIFAPFHALNISLLTLKGFPKRNFIMEMIKNGLVIASLFLFNSNIINLLIGFLFACFISYVIDLFFVKKIIGYKILDQIKDILPYLFLSLIMF